MSTEPIGHPPGPGNPPQPPDVAVLRRVDIVDAELRVLLSGTARDFLVEAEGGPLDPDVAAEVETLIRTHDFTRHPIATGLVGKSFMLRVVRTTGPAGSFYTVFSERTLLRRRIANIVQRYALTAGETELLRLVAGGYPLTEMARRLEIAPSPLRTQLRDLEEKVGCMGRKELAKLALGNGGPPTNSPSLASFPAAGSSTYPGRRAGNRHR